MTRAPGRRRAALWLEALWLAAALVSGPVGAADFTGDLQRMRDLAGKDPALARDGLSALRRQAIDAKRLDWRLAVDDIDCRLLSDLDGEKAIAVANQGIEAAAAAGPADASRLPLLRLRACRAGNLEETRGIGAGQQDLDEVLAEARARSLPAAEALALLERGVLRSRRGELLDGQADLLRACSLLKSVAQHNDLELCLGHLANHYKRVGDSDEALRMLGSLAESAARRGASFDESIYQINLAQVHQSLKDWQTALDYYRKALAASRRTNDVSGIVYAQHGVAEMLVRQGHPAEALPLLDDGLDRLRTLVDPIEQLRISILRAGVQATLGDAAGALAAVDTMEDPVRRSNDDRVRGEWLAEKVDILARLQRYHEAFDAQSELQQLSKRQWDQRLSSRSARLRMQFNRDQDLADLHALQQLNEQGRDLRQTQAVALLLFMLLLAVTLVYAVSKFRLARQLQTLALVDDLTGLPNRRAILARAQQQLEQCTDGPMALLVLDVDHFKAINDNHGHAVGDEVLRHLGRVMAAELRGQDSIGRLGGEEFLALLPRAGTTQARLVAERVRLAVATAPCDSSAGPLPITLSVGIVVHVGQAPALAVLIDRADSALYRAKAEGRNRVVLHAAEAATKEKIERPLSV